MTVAVLFAILGSLGINFTVDDETIRTLNTAFNFFTVAILVLRERRYRQKIEPDVHEVKEQLDKVADRTLHLDDYDGQDRRRPDAES